MENIDPMILSAVDNSLFDVDLDVPDPLFKVTVIRHYRLRGFNVFDNNTYVNISWRNPNITTIDNKTYNNPIPAMFNSAILYLRLTKGKDLRYLRSIDVYDKLKKGYKIEATYDIPNDVVYNLYASIIDELMIKDGITVYIENGVLMREYNGNTPSSEVSVIESKTLNLNSILSAESGNDILVKDNKLFANANVFETVKW